MIIIYLLVCYLLLCFIVGLIRLFYNIVSGAFGFKDRLDAPKHMKIGFYIAVIILIIIAL